IAKRLVSTDDPNLWQCVLENILADVEKKPGVLVQIGCYSRWYRPHGSTWTANGGFAWPGGCGPGYMAELDWSISLSWGWDAWINKDKIGKKKWSVWIAVPARTRRHKQAAVSTEWIDSRARNKWSFYGFRKSDGTWNCTAVDDVRQAD